jgi:hypothetical protein
MKEFAGYEFKGMFIACIISAVATFTLIYVAESNWSKYFILMIYIPLGLAYRPKRIRARGQNKIG